MSNRIHLDQNVAWILSASVSLALFGTIWFAVTKIDGGGDHHSKDPHSQYSEKAHNHGHSADHDSSSHAQTPGKDQETHTREIKNAPWSYDSETGPDHWGKLSPEYLDCSDGHMQSPINIERAVATRDLRPIHFSYKHSQIQLEHDGHTLLAKIDDGNYISFDGTRYNLEQMSFHLPSEHKVEGVPYEMEMHLVHRSKHGEVAVVAVFLEEGNRAHPTLDKLWQDLPAHANFKGPIAKLNLKKLLPEKKPYFNYVGSFTAPPCTEGIQWLVMRRSIKVSGKQLDQFNLIFRQNSRETQPLNKRIVKRNSAR